MFNNSDILLYALSTKQEMSWTTFKKAFSELSKRGLDSHSLELEETRKFRNQTRRYLSALAHCEFIFNESKGQVYGCPPTLARIPSLGFPQAILTGVRFSSGDASRTQESVEKLQQHCKSKGINLEQTKQPGKLSLIPTRIALQAEDISELQQLANSLNFTFLDNPPAWSVSYFSGSLQDYQQSLTWSQQRELNWEKQEFNLKNFAFQNNSLNSRISLRQYTHPKKSTKVYYLWKSQENVEVDLAWGKYLVFQEINKNIITYDAKKFLLAVPISAKLPKLLDRALTLCSGYIPKFVEKIPKIDKNIYGFDIYQSVPPQIAQITSQKLGQTLNQKSLTT